MHATLPLLADNDFPPLQRGKLETLQVNLGYRCNQTCLHCHVNAGPDRAEMMTAETAALIPGVLQAQGLKQLDLTGGAPELHPEFQNIIRAARATGAHVIDRCNLTILYEPGQDELAEFLAENQVEVVASLPCYSMKNVEQQRGKGVFGKSIAALQQLNALGYGSKATDRVLNLVYNPQGPVLPPDQASLEEDYRRELYNNFGIVFNHLLVLANMPINRFGSMLVSRNQFHDYMALLRENHKPANLEHVMCRSLISVDWQGYLYDCDFNQQLGLPVTGRERLHLSDLLQEDIRGRPINVADHCYGCTAGQGSSCSGAL